MKSEEEAIRASWNDNAAAWTQAVREGLIESRVRLTNAAVLSAVRDSEATRILDIGCGEGWLCRAVNELGMVAVGFDGCAALIAEAKRLGGGDYQHVSFDEFVADPSRVGAAFDTAVCNYSLLGEDILPILRSAAAVLAPGGTLIIQTVHPFTAAGENRYEQGWRSEDFKGLAAGFKSPMPWYFRTLSSWVSEVRKGGFELVECLEPMTSDNARPVSLVLMATRRARVDSMSI